MLRYRESTPQGSKSGRASRVGLFPRFKILMESVDKLSAATLSNVRPDSILRKEEMLGSESRDLLVQGSRFDDQVGCVAQNGDSDRQ